MSAMADTTFELDTLYSTGLDAQGQLIAVGDVDTHWEVQEAELGWVPAVHDLNHTCFGCSGPWSEHPTGSSRSRALTHPAHRRTDAATQRVFSWRTRFSLPPDVDPRAVTIAYTVGYDDVSLKDDGTRDQGCDHTVWINGVALRMTSTGTPIRTECQGVISQGASFLPGENTLEFRIHNGVSFYGLRFVKERATYELLPAPPVITSPTVGATVFTPQPTIQGTCQSGNTVIVSDDMMNVLCGATCVNGMFSCTVSAPLGEGGHTISAIQVDGIGRSSLPSSPFKFQYQQRATATSVMIRSPVDKGVYAPGTLVVSGSSTGVKGKVEIYADQATSIVWSKELVLEQGVEFSVKVEELVKEGDYLVKTSVFGVAGQEAADKRQITIKAAVVVDPPKEDPKKEPTEPVIDPPMEEPAPIAADEEGIADDGGCTMTPSRRPAATLWLLLGLGVALFRRRQRR